VKKVPRKASTMVILVAKSPKKRFYVGDNIPVELEIRNHTMQVIKEVAMSLCHVTYGVVMGYRADDQVTPPHTHTHHRTRTTAHAPPHTHHRTRTRTTAHAHAPPHTHHRTRTTAHAPPHTHTHACSSHRTQCRKGNKRRS
jgi:hypothetical protein